MTVNITGTAITPRGAVKPGARITLRRAVWDVVSQEGGFVIPDEINIQSALDGTVNFHILPGQYNGTAIVAVGLTVDFKFNVPDTSSALFQDCVGAAWVPVPPDSVTAAQNARDDAIEAAELAAEIVAPFANLTDAIGLASRLVQEKVNELNLGFNNGTTDTQIFPNAQSTSQGIAFAKVGSQRKVFLLQRVAGSGSWAADERMRIVEFNISDDGTAINHVSFSPELNFGHQMISARVIDGQVWIYGSIPVDGVYTGANIGKGFARIPYRGALTDQSEMEIVQMFGFAGSGHTLQNYRTAYAYVDDDYVLLSASDITDDPEIVGDIETGDSKIVIYNLSDVEGASDPLEVIPIAVWHRPRPSEIQNNYTQGVCIAGGHVWVQCGFFPPLLQHMMQVFTIDGRLVAEFHMDGPRGDFENSQLRGIGDLGIPTSFEPEGLTTDDNGDVISLCMDIWRTPTSVVSRGSQAFAAYRSSMPVGTPCTNHFWWTPVNLAPSGAWDATTAYTIGGYTRRTKVLHRVKVPVGGEREKPLSSGVCLRDSAAAIPIGPTGVDVTIPAFEGYSVQSFAINAQEYRELFSYASSNAMRWRDAREDGDVTKYAQLAYTTWRDGDTRSLAEFRVSRGALAWGGGWNVGGWDDSASPYTFTAFSGAPTGETGGEFKLWRTHATLNVLLQGNAVNGTASDNAPTIGALIAASHDTSQVYKGKLTKTNQINTQFEPGVYRVAGAADAATVGAPGPQNSGGILQIFRQNAPASSGSDRNTAGDGVQIYTQRSNQGTFKPRQWMRNAQGGVWATWTEVVTDATVMTSIAAAPWFVGQTAVVSGIVYVATGTSSASDWVRVSREVGVLRSVYASGVRKVVTSTTEMELDSATIPGGILGPNGYLVIRVQTGQTNNTNNKTFRLKIGGQTVVGSTAAYTGSSATNRLIYWHNRGSETSQVVQGAAAESGTAETSVAVTTTTVNTASAFNVEFTGQLAVSGDEIALESVTIEAVYMP